MNQKRCECDSFGTGKNPHEPHKCTVTHNLKPFLIGQNNGIKVHTLCDYCWLPEMIQVDDGVNIKKELHLAYLYFRTNFCTTYREKRNE